jgi:osmoprotectant transport system substrate-binding protein
MKTRTPLAAVLVTAALVAAACGSDDNAAPAATTTPPATTAAPSATTAAMATPAGPPIAFKPLDAGGPLTVAALDNGDVQIALLFSSDGVISQKGFVTLEDDKQLQPSENLVAVGRKDKMTPAVTALIDPALAKLTTDELQALNVKMNTDKQDPADVAKAWLDSVGALTPGTSLSGQSFTVGSSNFNEQELVSSMVSQILQANGAKVTEKFKIGAREVVAPALENGDIDLYVEYVGSYLTFLGGTPTSDPAATLADLTQRAGAKGIAVGTPAPAEDKNAFVVTKATADKYSLAKISDLLGVTDQLTLGGPPECPERPLCIKGLESVYGLQFKV